MRFERLIEAADKNKDGTLSLDELKDAPRPGIDQMGRGSAEYYMPDLDDPTSRGTRIQPTFFVDHTSVPLGTTDLDRRLTLASLMTSADNPWFARAFVNRIWTEMLGAGFYMPVDDLGPQREAVLPDVLDALASGFVASGYDIKWVFRTIANTQAYRRRLHPSTESGPALFAAASPTRLRSDQIYHALQEALGTGSLIERRGPQGRNPGGMMAAPGDAGRIVFNQLFGFDPSTPQDDVMGTIPQALFLMNSPVTASPSTVAVRQCSDVCYAISPTTPMDSLNCISASCRGNRPKPSSPFAANISAR